MFNKPPHWKITKHKMPNWLHISATPTENRLIKTPRKTGECKLLFFVSFHLLVNNVVIFVSRCLSSQKPIKDTVKNDELCFLPLSLFNKMIDSAARRRFSVRFPQMNCPAERRRCTLIKLGFGGLCLSDFALLSRGFQYARSGM